MSIEYDYNPEPEAEPVPAGAADSGEQRPQPRESAPDFQDERTQRIADATFNDEDGEGANAEWWDMLASIDRDLARAAAADNLANAARAVLAYESYPSRKNLSALREAVAAYPKGLR